LVRGGGSRASCDYLGPRRAPSSGTFAATRSLDDDKLADYMRKATFKTVVGDVKFGPKGEWAEERTLAAQFQDIKSNSIDEFRDPSKEKVIHPPQFKSGDIIYPYESALSN